MSLTKIGGSIIGSYTPAGTGAVSRTLESKINEVTSVADFGAIGDGSDESTKIQAALDSGSTIAFDGSKTYSIAKPLKFANNKRFLGNKCTIKALAGFAGITVQKAGTASPYTNGTTTALVFIGQTSNIHVEDFILDCDGIANHGVETFHMNQATSVLRGLYVTDAVSHGFFNVGSQVSSITDCSSRLSGGYGYYFGSCNNLIMDKCTSEYNSSHGITVEKGFTGYSSGMVISNCTIQNNTLGYGIYLIDNTTPVRINGCWLEANSNDTAPTGMSGIRIGATDESTPANANIQDNYLIQITSTTALTDGDTYSISFGTDSTGYARNNTLTNGGISGGTLRNLVYVTTGSATTALVKTDFNFYGGAGTIRETVYGGASSSAIKPISSSAYHSNELVFWAMGTPDITTWTPILTAAKGSATEVTISGAENNGGAFGQFILKTYSAMSNDTRESFGEIGVGSTHTLVASTSTFYSPIVGTTAAYVPFVRWNGNDLEIKLGNIAGDRMIIEVMTRFQLVANTHIWLI